MKMKCILLSAMLSMAALSVSHADSIKLIVSDVTVDSFRTIEDSIYIPDSVLAGNIGIGANYCECGETYLGRGNKTLTVKPDQSIITSDGNTLSKKVVMAGKETLYPLRAIAEDFGIDVKWDEATRTASVVTREQLVISPEGKYALILDVRTPEEFAAGHVEGAFNIPLKDLPDKAVSLGQYIDQPILIYCKGGARSAQAVDILLDMDFTQIFHLYKGYDSLNALKGSH